MQNRAVNSARFLGFKDLRQLTWQILDVLPTAARRAVTKTGE